MSMGDIVDIPAEDMDPEELKAINKRRQFEYLKQQYGKRKHPKDVHDLVSFAFNIGEMAEDVSDYATSASDYVEFAQDVESMLPGITERTHNAMERLLEVSLEINDIFTDAGELAVNAARKQGA